MNAPADFQTYYDTELRPVLEELDERRRGVLTNLLVAAAAIVVVAGGIAVFAAGSQLVILPLVLGVLGMAAAWWLLTRRFRREFKLRIIGPLVRFVSPDLSYDPDGSIPRHDFVASSLFLQGIDRYRGEDLVSGHVDRTAIRFSEIHAEYKTTTRDSKGHTQTQWHTIFKGLFFVADFNKHFSGRTVVLPDQAERLLGRLGKTLQSLSIGRDPLVKLEDPEFEKAFVVYGSDQTEARYILSTSLMRRLLEYQQRAGARLYAAFVHSNLYLGLSTRRNLFEPRLFRSLLDIRMAETFLQDLQMAVGVVDALNLNTRIWTKE
jgi:hypothetical protein